MLCTLLWATSTHAGGAVAGNELAPKLAALVAQSRIPPAKIGYSVADKAGTVLAEHNAHAPFIPASLVKLATAHAALTLLTEDAPENPLGQDSALDIPTLVRKTLSDSDRDAAQTLGRALEARGISPQRAALALPLPPTEVRLLDWTGHERQNRLSAHAVRILLETAAKAPKAERFVQTLPLAGRSGTLRERFRDTNAENRLRAKTGRLLHVDALAGYVDAASPNEVRFAIIVNQDRIPQDLAAEFLDAFAKTLATPRS